MRRIVLLSVAAVAGWVLTPVIDATVRGTIDDRTLADMRRYGEPIPEVDLPDPRRPADDERVAARHSASRQGAA